LPWKQDLFDAIVTTAVTEASRGGIPATVKMRKGIDADHTTFLDAAETARNAGVSAVALHGRTAADLYSGKADWDAIARLKDPPGDTAPGLANGGISAAAGALVMMAVTGGAGVVIGRGCEGRPGVFGDLANALNGGEERRRPGLAEVGRAVDKHGQ